MSYSITIVVVLYVTLWQWHTICDRARYMYVYWSLLFVCHTLYTMPDRWKKNVSHYLMGSWYTTSIPTAPISQSNCRDMWSMLNGKLGFFYAVPTISVQYLNDIYSRTKCLRTRKTTLNYKLDKWRVPTPNSRYDTWIAFTS